MSVEESVTNWLHAFQAGDQEAVRQLWKRYFNRMVGLARLKLGHSPRGAADEEDVAVSAFDSFCQGVEQGQFSRLQDRDDLWRMLVVITVRKAVNLIHHQGRQKRGGDQVPQTDDEVLQGLLSREPSPAITAAMNDECLRLFDLLGDEMLRKLVRLKLEGHTNTESASLLGRDEDRSPFSWPLILGAIGVAVLELLMARWFSHAYADSASPSHRLTASPSQPSAEAA